MNIYIKILLAKWEDANLADTVRSNDMQGCQPYSVNWFQQYVEYRDVLSFLAMSVAVVCHRMKYLPQTLPNCCSL